MTIGRCAVVAVASCLVSMTVTAAADPLEDSIRYVRSLSDDCVYDHGYRCMEVAEDDFVSPNPDRVFVPGTYLGAWSSSYRDFSAITEMTEEQKQLKHYKISFTEDEEHYIVLYLGLLLPRIEDGGITGTLRSTFGLTTKYWINKRTLDVDKRLFLR